MQGQLESFLRGMATPEAIKTAIERTRVDAACNSKHECDGKSTHRVWCWNALHCKTDLADALSLTPLPNPTLHVPNPGDDGVVRDGRWSTQRPCLL